jgi:Major capsid protein Gp23
MVVYQANGRPVLACGGGHINTFTETLEWGQRLAETPIGVPKGQKGGLWEARGWKELVAHMPEHKRAQAAIMLENCRGEFGRLEETTRTANLGTFDKWIFPILANMVENDVIDQLVALQPMPGPVSQVVYMDVVTGRRKGNVPAGSPVWRALQGAVDRFSDSDEVVESESAGSTDGTGTVTATLDWAPLRPGTLRVYAGADESQDDGNGLILAAGSITGGTIDYITGELTVNASANTAVAVTYVFNSEGNANIMEYDLKLSSSPVTAKPRKLKMRWTEEANQNLQSMYNIRAESVLMNAITNALQYQKHREVIFDLRARADAGYVEWDATPPPNVNYQAHKYSLVDAFETAKNFIFLATNMAAGNWILTGMAAATVVQTLPMFTPKNNGSKMQGITYIGDLGNCKVFVDPHFPINEFIVGFKGDQFLNTGYVLAEYQKLYTTPDITLPDFVHQRGFATSYAKKFINAKFYCRGAVVNSPTAFGPIIG